MTGITSVVNYALINQKISVTQNTTKRQADP